MQRYEINLKRQNDINKMSQYLAVLFFCCIFAAQNERYDPIEFATDSSEGKDRERTDEDLGRVASSVCGADSRGVGAAAFRGLPRRGEGLHGCADGE